MKRNQAWQGPIIRLLQQAQPGTQTVSAICREAGSARTTFYRRPEQFGAMSVPQAQRPEGRENHNARLKALRAAPDRGIDALKEFLAEK